MASDARPSFLAASLALLILPFGMYLASGEDDWLAVTIAGEPALLAAYLIRARRPGPLSARLLLLAPLLAVLAFFALLVAVLA